MPTIQELEKLKKLKDRSIMSRQEVLIGLNMMGIEHSRGVDIFYRSFVEEQIACLQGGDGPGSYIRRSVQYRAYEMMFDVMDRLDQLNRQRNANETEKLYSKFLGHIICNKLDDLKRAVKEMESQQFSAENGNTAIRVQARYQGQLLRINNLRIRFDEDDKYAAFCRERKDFYFTSM